VERATVHVAAALATLLLAAPAAQAQTVHLRGTTRTATVSLSPGATKRVFVECPQQRGHKQDVALSGTSAPPSAVDLRSSVPGSRRWAFRFHNDGTATHRAKAIVRCLRVPFPTGIRRIAYRFSRRARDVNLSPGEVRSVPVVCPNGFAPSGYGFRRVSGRLRFYGVVQSATDVRFGLQEVGGANASVRLFIRCVARRGLARTRGGTRLAFRIRITRRSFTDAIPTIRGLVRHRCFRGDSSLSPGFRHTPVGPLALLGQRVAGHRSARWLFFNTAPVPLPVRTYLLCLDGQSVLRSL
jgi:hypothetical protein